jgi:uncharacterized damage-inducible protein DinB
MSMTLDDAKLLYRYMDWADDRILAQAAQIDAAQFSAVVDCGVSFGSLHGTLLHMVDTLYNWRLNFEGYFRDLRTPDEFDATELKLADFPTFEAVTARWQVERAAMWAYLDTLDDAQIAGMIYYTLPSGTVRERTLWHALLHVVNHSMQHRSEAAALLTRLGHSPGDVDLVVFLNQHLGLPD